MTYQGFKRRVAQEGHTIADLRCEQQPTSKVLDLIDSCRSLDEYERFVTALENDTDEEIADIEGYGTGIDCDGVPLQRVTDGRRSWNARQW